MNDDLYYSVENIENEDDFLSFMELLIKDYKTNRRTWENTTLSTYLEAIADCTDGIDQRHKNLHMTPPPNPSWRRFADILLTATIYE